MITNLLSAIPYFGQNLVELICIKLRKKTNKLKKIIKIIYRYLCSMLNFDIFFRFLYCFKTFFVHFNSTPKDINELPKIGEVNWSKVRKEKPLTEMDTKRLKSIPFSFLARLAGLIDGDGYISIVSSDKIRNCVSISLKIGLIYKDLPMLNKFLKF